MGIDLETMRLFLQIADLKSFTQASKLCYISQPSLSRRIKELEAILGFKLFERVKSGVELTDEGQEFYKRASFLIAEFDSFVSTYAKNSNEGVFFGTISVAYQRAARHLVRRINDDFLNEYPNVKLKCDLLPILNPVEALISGEYDCVYMFSKEYDRIKQRNLVAIPVDSLPWTIIMKKNNPLCKKEHIYLDDLKNEKYVFAERSVSPAIFDETVGILSQRGLSPLIVKLTHDIENIITYICQYNAITIAAENVYGITEKDDVVYRIIEDYPTRFDIYLVASEERMTPTLEEYYENVKEYYALRKKE